MRYRSPTEAEIRSALESVGVTVRSEKGSAIEVDASPAVYFADGRRDWTEELARMRELVAVLPHAHVKGTPSTSTARHYIDVGHWLAHGCCAA